MDVIINRDCPVVPELCKPLVSQGRALLNFLFCLGYDPLNPPVGDLLRRLEHLEGNWLVLTPVHWQASHNDAMITAVATDLLLEEADLKRQFNEYATHLAQEEGCLHYYDEETWLLPMPNKPLLKTKPVYQIKNSSLMPELALMDSSMYWQKFFTESQMFFAAQPIKSALNGVWPWGSALLTDKKPIAVCADAQWIASAQMSASNATLYNPSLSLQSFQILLLNDYELLSAAHQEELKKIPARWYWNNSAYISSELNWFTRLWRTLIHAH